jgi:phage gp29-like protein
MARKETTGQLLRKTEKWREFYNPLRGLTIQRAVCLLEAYRRGEMTELQWLYSHIEEGDATLLALVERRTSALSELDWDVLIVEDNDLPKGSTRDQAEEQRDYLAEVYGQIDNLREAIEFLALATFRGFAHVQKQDRDGDGIVDHLEPLDQWNWVRDGMFGDWFYNPKAQAVTADALKNSPDAIIEPSQFIIREVPRHLDRIALIKRVRTNLAEKDWTAFLEIYGIPGGVATMPAQAPNTDAEKNKYLAMAEDVAGGGNGVLPFGSTWTPNDGPRGENPFRDFLRYLDEQLILAGTGGLLTMLAESGSGTLAGNAHQKTFESIARAEGRKVSEVFQKQFDHALIRQKFGEDAPVLAYFELNRSDLSEDEMGFVRDVVKLLLQGKTTRSVLSNQMELKELVGDAGLPVNAEYFDPYIPVESEGGPLVTGELVLDSEQDVIGARPEQLAAGATPGGEEGGISGSRNSPLRPERAPTGLKNRMAELRKMFAAGVSEDLKPVANRLQAIQSMPDGAEKEAALQSFLNWVESGRAAMAVNGDPQSAKALEEALSKGLAAGLTGRRKKA